MRCSLAPAVLVVLGTICCTSGNPAPQSEGNPLYVDPNKVSFSDNHGTSCDDLVVIKGAKADFEGIGAENIWLSQHYPDCRKVGAGLGNCPDRVTDVVEIETREGMRVTVMFDISGSFGKS